MNQSEIDQMKALVRESIDWLKQFEGYARGFGMVTTMADPAEELIVRLERALDNG